MGMVYGSLACVLIGAILYKVTHSPAIKYIGYSFWWGGWGLLVTWIISVVFDVPFTKGLGLIVLVSGWLVIEGTRAILRKIQK
jgi:hypothetical protein